MVHGVDGNRVKFGSQLTLVVPNEDAGYFPDLERLGGTFCRLGVVDVKRSKDCFVFEVGCYPQEAGGNLRCLGFPSLPMLPSLATSRAVIFASFDAVLTSSSSSCLEVTVETV